MKKTLFLICFTSAAFLSAYSQKRNITLEDIWKTGKFVPKTIDELQSMPDGIHYTAMVSDKNYQFIIEYSYATGKPADTLLTLGMNRRNNLPVDNYAVSDDARYILLSSATERIYRHSTIALYMIYDRTKKMMFPLTNSGKVMYPLFSPDSKKVAFIDKGNLYVKSLEDGSITQVTNDGTDDVFNGVSDWVYEEEFSVTRAFFWSPDSKMIAYYHFDDSKVHPFSMMEYNDSLYPYIYTFKYPKAGTPNPAVSIYLYNTATGKIMNVSNPVRFEYIPRLVWTQDSRLLSVQYMNRHQDSLTLVLINTATGTGKPILTETDKTYIDINDVLTFIDKNKQFLWMSDRDGYNHLYRYSISGKLLNRVTGGNWDITDFKGVDEKNRKVFYLSTEISPIDRTLYSIGLNGKNKHILSSDTGYNDITFSSENHYYINSFSDAMHPPVITIHNADGKLLRTIEDNHSLLDTLSHFQLAKKDFFSFTTKDGVTLNGWMIKPPGFDPAKKYPLLMYVYGGPGINTVNNDWEGAGYLWDEMLAEKGYIIASVDNRGTGGRGSQFQKCTYLHLGILETEDQMEAARYFSSLGIVDKTRIGIWGWSYGGYMAALCITKGAAWFKTAISVAPVTNWGYYDTIYTERYMRTPKENKKGYHDGSPLYYADMLKGHYLIVHGTGDDNVHFQNTVEWAKALEDAGKPFSLIIFPDKNHGIYGGNARYYLYSQMTNFIMNNL